MIFARRKRKSGSFFVLETIIRLLPSLDILTRYGRFCCMKWYHIRHEARTPLPLQQMWHERSYGVENLATEFKVYISLNNVYAFNDTHLFDCLRSTSLLHMMQPKMVEIRSLAHYKSPSIQSQPYSLNRSKCERGENAHKKYYVSTTLSPPHPSTLQS
jgi:hypothetical protein